MRLRARDLTEIRRTRRETVLEVRGRIELFGHTLKRILIFVSEAERAIEVLPLLSALQQAFGLEPLEVRQIAQRGQPESLQECPRRDIGERGAGLGGADRPVDQAAALERGDDVTTDLPPRQPGNLPPCDRLQISDRG